MGMAEGSMRRQFSRVNCWRIQGIQVQGPARLAAAISGLSLHAFVDDERCEAVAEVVEAESLTTFETDANLNGCGPNFGCGQHAGTQRRSALHLCGWDNPVLRLHSESLGQSPRVFCWFRAPDTRAILCHNVFAELTVLVLAERNGKTLPCPAVPQFSN